MKVVCCIISLLTQNEKKKKKNPTGRKLKGINRIERKLQTSHQLEFVELIFVLVFHFPMVLREISL